MSGGSQEIKNSFIVKTGCIDGNKYKNYKDCVAFFKDYELEQPFNREAYEILTVKQERMVYMQVDGYFDEEKDVSFELEIIDCIYSVVSEMLLSSGELEIEDLRLAAYHGSKWTYVHGDKKEWKLFLQIVFQNLKCPAGKSMIGFYQAFRDAAEKDETASKLLFRPTTTSYASLGTGAGGSVCIVDGNVYA
jgi:hypothetical protein